ncbi:MAG: hypothetical protein ACOCT0_00740 [Halobacteriota archaeon]
MTTGGLIVEPVRRHDDVSFDGFDGRPLDKEIVADGRSAVSRLLQEPVAIGRRSTGLTAGDGVLRR